MHFLLSFQEDIRARQNGNIFWEKEEEMSSIWPNLP
jgi:hypothetical protein